MEDIFTNNKFSMIKNNKDLWYDLKSIFQMDKHPK
jgi:hypothetical protein